MMRTKFFGLLMLLCACGGSGGGAPPAKTNECARDEDCDDQIGCTRDRCGTSVGGLRVCEHEPRDEDCGAGQRCIVVASGPSGCMSDAVIACLGRSEGQACEVSDPCRAGAGVCRSGQCEYAQKECAAGPCEESLGCDPATGECRSRAVEDGTPCVFAADPCRPARCHEGVCEPGDGPLCDDQDPCTDDRCVGTTCEHTRVPDGTACDDGDPCSDGEVCGPDGCGGGAPRDCDDQNACTADSCDPAQGGCVHAPMPDGEACFVGQDRCRPGTCGAGVCANERAPDCDDHDPCTLDTCDPTSGCRHAPQSGTPCDDGNACTAPDQCENGVCESGPMKLCNDGDRCTMDACDPKNGCVFTPITPCCGNHLVEAGEQCDAGPAGSEGCTVSCKYSPFTLAEPPSGGRHVSVAWSQKTSSGLVAYEAQHDTRAVVVRRLSDALNVGPETVIYDYGANGTHGLTVIDTPDGPSDFLLVVYRYVSVDLLALTADGLIANSWMDAWTVYDPNVAFGRIRAGRLPQRRFRVVWQDAEICSGSNAVPIIQTATADLDSGVFDAPVRLGGGSCVPWYPVLLGDLCEAGKVGAIAWAERESGGPAGKVVRSKVVPYDQTGLASPILLAESASDAAFPPLCAAPDAQSLMAVYVRLDSAQNVLQVQSKSLSRSGGVLGGPWTLQEVSAQSLSQEPICLPGFGSMLPLSDGRFLLLCPRVLISGGSFGNARMESRLLRKDGQPDTDFVPLVLQKYPFALNARLALGPRADAIATWYETDALGESIESEPQVLRLFVFGNGVW